MMQVHFLQAVATTNLLVPKAKGGCSCSEPILAPSCKDDYRSCILAKVLVRYMGDLTLPTAGCRSHPP